VLVFLKVENSEPLPWVGVRSGGRRRKPKRGIFIWNRRNPLRRPIRTNKTK
jgi:hypothetical protein